VIAQAYAHFPAIASAKTALYLRERGSMPDVTAGSGRPVSFGEKEIANRAESAHGLFMHEKGAGAGRPASGRRT